MPPTAKYVGRPTQFGNPFRVGVLHNSGLLAIMYSFEEFEKLHKAGGITPKDVDECLSLYRLLLEAKLRLWGEPAFTAWLRMLEGYDLACWCPLSSKCHADILAQYFNKYCINTTQHL